MAQIYIGLAFVSIILAVIAQVVLKSSANQDHQSALREFVNLRTFVGYSLFTVGFVCSALAYKEVDLCFIPLVEAFGYVFVLVMGHFFLNDPINRRKTAAIAIIIFGVFIFKIEDILPLFWNA